MCAISDPPALRPEADVCTAQPCALSTARDAAHARLKLCSPERRPDCCTSSCASCAGNTSAKGHIPFIIFALLDVLRAFPGQVHENPWPLQGPVAVLLDPIQLQQWDKALGLTRHIWCCMLLMQSLTRFDGWL